MLNYEVVICQKIHGNLLSVPEERQMRRALAIFIWVELNIFIVVLQGYVLNLC